MVKQLDIVALVPARGGSKRLPQKNIRPLAYFPLIAYTLQAALKSGIFKSIVVSTDCKETAKIGLAYGADTIIDRPAGISGELSHDFEWVSHALEHLPPFNCFAILRPTSPFRTADTIIRAWNLFKARQPCDSLRAVQKVREHPYKTWYKVGDFIDPYVEFKKGNIKGYDLPYQSLPEMYVQNGCLQIAHTDTLRKYGNVTGWRVIPFKTQGHEGIDINTVEDIWLAESIINGHVGKTADIMCGYREGGKANDGMTHREFMDWMQKNIQGGR